MSTATSHIGVVFGSMLIGGPGTNISAALRVTTTEGAIELLDVFAKHGHTEIDTARMYGGGTTEERLGTIDWQERGLKMATKLFPTKGKNMTFLFKDMFSHSPDDLRKGLGDSLTALKANKIDLFYLHAPDRSVPYEDTLREINKMHSEGLFERFGLSNYPAWEVAQICEICKANNWVLPTVYQGMYNALCRTIEPELIPCLRAYGISFYAYNPLAGGFLTSRYKRDQAVSEFSSFDRFHPDRPWAVHQRARYWNEANFAALDVLRSVISQHGISETEAALRWLAHHSVLRKESGDKVILGAGRKEHLEDNLRALESGPLPADVVEVFEKAWEQARALPVQYFT
ncbi:NADP-dependent oxidoreductase domain-containing protein [Roridomyces roridus]|uniref:NADP-dependent oxidoreductase domain-containing protein n=1 Tax=Roridomyces roridus TaxID=1738132 RepID=A0AAD7FQR5_9AGAR|nr:NADP-dependent oxidoreductase domain-containing protein [Roridomyces roridus]